jgi:hypothetical protein
MEFYVLGLVASIAFVMMGDAPSWRCMIIVTALALLAAAVLDTAIPYLEDQLRWPHRSEVVVHLFGRYGLSLEGLFALPVAIIAAAVAARRNWVRIRDPNDLRR